MEILVRNLWNGCQTFFWKSFQWVPLEWQMKKRPEMWGNSNSIILFFISEKLLASQHVGLFHFLFYFFGEISDLFEEIEVNNTTRIILWYNMKLFLTKHFLREIWIYIFLLSLYHIIFKGFVCKHYMYKLFFKPFEIG